ncbi:MAG: proton-conducting transporter membrane subunit [Candidatus Omnitrophota bacterium]|jgi:hydrogenase-4 component B
MLFRTEIFEDKHMGYLNIKFSLLFDPLSLFFLVVILLVSAPSALYSVGYMKGEYPGRKIALGWALLIAFIVSMALVVTVNNALIFLIAWESMSLISYFLVTFDTHSEKSVRAGVIYIVMTHIGTAFITIALLIFHKYAGSFDMNAFKAAASGMPLNIRNTVFILLLAGFGTKAGIVPLHIWLPYAHPQAPSHISSLMSGVMIKTAIYGILRFIVFTLGVGDLWWANLILVLAMVSCLVGVMYALMERDIKKLLAYSSVENMGIIFLGVGASMLFMKMEMPVLAVFALSAGLYHLVNHAIFKSLLFLCAGAVYKYTGTRNMEKLGGLIKSMPWTAAAFLVGAMAISAVAPLNGFVSEWLTLQAFFMGAVAAAGGYKIFLACAAAVLALTGGLAASCFVKAFGMTFLAMPRSVKYEGAKDASLTMKISMAFLAILVFVSAFAAAAIIKALVMVSGCATRINTAHMNFTLNNFTLAPQNGSGACLSTPAAALAITVLVIIAAAAFYLGTRKSKTVIDRTWDCGYYKLSPRTEYSATAFSKPFRIAFGFFLLPYTRTEKIRESFYHIKSFKYEVFFTPIFKRYIYEPAINAVFVIARHIKKLQPGSIHVYLAYIFVTILALIIFINRF